MLTPLKHRACLFYYLTSIIWCVFHCGGNCLQEAKTQTHIWGELTVNDIGVVEFRVCVVPGVLTWLLHVFIDVPTSVLIKHSKYHTPLFVRTNLCATIFRTYTGYYLEWVAGRNCLVCSLILWIIFEMFLLPGVLWHRWPHPCRWVKCPPTQRPSPSLGRQCSDTAGSDTEGLRSRAHHLLSASRCSQTYHWGALPWSAGLSLQLLNYIRWNFDDVNLANCRKQCEKKTNRDLNTK